VKVRSETLGEVPLQVELRENSYEGHPLVSRNPDAPVARAIEKATSGAAAALAFLEAVYPSISRAG
jgi:MinD-like ATPase involved in chromosome partitioning or flagellar assembly